MSLYFRGKEIKYIASDLDGTLLFGEGHVLEDEVYELIQECVNNDVQFIIASGRTYENEKIVLKPIVDQVSYIAGSGSMGVHNGKILFNHILDKEHVKKLVEIAHSIDGCATFASTRNGFYTDTKHDFFMNHMMHNVKIHLKLVDDLTLLNEPIEKFSIFYYDGADLIKNRFEEYIDTIDIVLSGPQWIDFLLPNVNKGSALLEILNSLNIDINDGIAFGDQENDIQMIQNAGIGCCMKTGVPQAQEVADYIIDTPKTILKEMLKK